VSGDLLPALVPVAVLILAVVGYGLVDLARRPRAPYLPKWAWVLVMLLAMPWGAVVYLALARSTRTPAVQPAPMVVGPPPGPALPVTGGLVVRTDGLTRDYGAGAGLFDVDLRVPQGSVYGLVGPNGAGKTTLLTILTGLRRADRGTVHIGASRQRIAVCPDVPEFEPWLTAFEVVDLARFYVAPDLPAEAVPGTLHTVGLLDQADRRVGGFSRGMTQRLRPVPRHRANGACSAQIATYSSALRRNSRASAFARRPRAKEYAGTATTGQLACRRQ
jgi:hypothetical protein